MDRHGISAFIAKIMIVAIMLPLSASAAQTLTIRMVEAHNRSEQTDASLNDVAPSLRRSLPYKGFRQIGSSAHSLPAGGESQLSGGYKVKVSGPASNCAVTISKNNKSLLTTSVSLRGSTPLIVGGFSAGESRHLFVLKLK